MLGLLVDCGNSGSKAYQSGRCFAIIAALFYVPAAAMTDMSLPILYQDEHLLMLNKPAGLLTVPGKGPEKQDCLINHVLKYNPNARVVHRLDQGTSGIVMIPLNYPAQRTLTQQFQGRGVHKQYLAVVAGLVREDEGEIHLPLICDWPNRPLQKVCHVTGKPALTRYWVVERDPVTGTSRVLLEPVSGRTHQLRVHMLNMGHPILGDQLYAPAAIKVSAPRLLLHARRIQLHHPVSGDVLTVECPEDF